MKAKIRQIGELTVVLCERGHVIESHRFEPHSRFEDEWARRHEGDRFDQMAERCQGEGHEHR